MAYNSHRAMRFEWDDAKNTANFDKHGIWFEEAQTVWADGYAAEYFDPDPSESEDRFIRVDTPPGAELCWWCSVSAIAAGRFGSFRPGRLLPGR